MEPLDFRVLIFNERARKRPTQNLVTYSELDARLKRGGGGEDGLFLHPV
jgi:hypothetical protein